MALLPGAPEETFRGGLACRWAQPDAAVPLGQGGCLVPHQRPASSARGKGARVRAVLCRAFGPPSGLTLEEVPEPRPGPGQVLIRVEACAVNFPDTLMVQGRYQVRPPLPFSPGGEVAGVVAELGE